MSEADKLVRWLSERMRCKNCGGNVEFIAVEDGKSVVTKDLMDTRDGAPSSFVGHPVSKSQERRLEVQNDK